MIVCKFGGSSLADAESVRNAARIVASSEDRRAIVVSAPGKRDRADRKITDLLYLCHELAAEGISFGEPFSIIRQRFLQMAQELGSDLDMEGLLGQVEQEIKASESPEFVASRGEYLSGRLMASHLDARFVDAADCIRIAPDGRIDPASYQLVAEQIVDHELTVCPGFYGADRTGRIRTFSRGGSDVTGALVARALAASVYENWTDVSGLLMADPRVVQDPRPMREVTYREIRELAYMGARVFHEEAIFPVYPEAIPINIKNTHAPDDPGTMIVARRNPGRDAVAGIAGRPGFTLFRVEKLLLNREVGFGRRLLEIFESHGVSFEHAPTGIDTIGVIVRDENLGDRGEAIKSEITRVLEPDRVELRPGLALIATVGEGMNHRPGVAARLFGALAEDGVNIRIIDQGSSEINIIVGVEQSDYKRAVNAIYGAFEAG
jgi:aspartate kinase